MQANGEASEGSPSAEASAVAANALVVNAVLSGPWSVVLSEPSIGAVSEVEAWRGVVAARELAKGVNA